MTHLWLLSWLALFVGAAALALGLMAGRAARRLAPPTPTLPLSFYAVWLASTLLLGLAMVRLGASGADFVAARGIALGALGGWALCALTRGRSGPESAPVVFGLGTVVVAAGRLWLTHGEVSGLIALAVGAGLAILCLGVAPALLDPEAENEGDGATVGLLYLVCLAGAVLIGFGRAAARQQEFWADVPLLLGAVLSLASAVAGRTRLPAGLVPLGSALVLILLPLSRIAPSWRPLELVVLGAVVFGLLARLGRSAGDRQQSAAGLVLLAAGSALAFALWSGYGLALLIGGGWLVSGSVLLSGDGGRAGRVGMGFAAVLLVYRLATLQNGPAVHASGPGDIWDLFAVSLGALLPLAAAEWAAGGGDGLRSARWAALLQWVVVLALPALLLDYIWQPRSVVGVLLGVAVGLLLAAGQARLRQEAALLSGLLFSLILFQFLPLITHINEPTRTVRVALVVLGAAALILRLLVPTDGAARKGEPDGLTSSPRA